MEKIYIDANIFIHAAINQEELGDSARKVLEKIKSGHYGTSVLTFDEVFWKVKQMRSKEFACRITEALLAIPNLVFLDATYDVISAAHFLLERYDIGPRDAIHAASALAHGIKLILSTDSDFDKIAGITRLKLV